MKKFLFIFKHFCHSRENGNLVTRLKLVHWIPAYAGMTIIIGLFFAFPAYGATSVFYSVGQSSSDMKVASTVTITSGAAVFSAAQTGNIGVGDRVTYDSDNKIAYISAKTNSDQMHWTLITATGGTPTDVTGVTVNSITREFTSLNSAEDLATNSSHLNTTDLVAGNFQLNFPCYYDTGADTTAVTIDGYTTGASNYIKVYTPNNTSTESNFSQRHEGKWDEGKFILTASNASAIDCNEGYVYIDGIQIKLISSISDRFGVVSDPPSSGMWVKISNNIIKGSVSGSASNVTGVKGNVAGTTYEISNNIVYNFTGSSGSNMIGFYLDYGNFYVYNNTIYNCYNYGIAIYMGTFVLKNNLVQNSGTNNYITWNSAFSSSSTNNLITRTPSDGAFGASADSGTTSATIGTDTKKLRQTGQDFTTTVKVGMIVKNTTDTTYSYVTRVNSDTELELNDDIMDDSENFTIYTNRFGKVRFADEANQDFHLHPLDTAALNNGADLTSDGSLPITTDIDGHSRPTQSYFDIGADEATTKIYRSVAPDADGNMSALTTGSANGMTLEGGSPYGNLSGLIVATFDVPLADNIGVGDALQYDADNDGDIDASDKIVFIHERLDSTHYVVKKSDGTNPTAMTFPDTNWSIFRAYTSLSNAEAGTENTGIDSDVVNFDTWSGGKDLTTNNEQWNIACYANSSTYEADATAVTIDGWTTASANYIKIYTPINVNEVGVSQRHAGKWDDGKYRLEVSSVNNSASLNIDVADVRVDGLQVSFSPTNGAISAGGLYIGVGTALNVTDIRVSSSIIKKTTTNNAVYQNGIAAISGRNVKLYNNIVYNITGGTNSNRGIMSGGATATAYVYNNTVNNATNSSYQAENGGRIIAKNNIAQGSAVGFIALAGGTFDAASANNLSNGVDAPGSNPQNSKDVTFVNETAGSEDLHLSASDTVAKNYGADLRTDPYLPITTDIDAGATGCQDPQAPGGSACANRPSGSAFDIGADERLKNVYYSVSGGGDTTTDRKVASSATIANGLMTFSAPQTGNIGVGDVIDYDSDNKKAYISGKVDQSNWYVVNNLGDKPADISSGVTVNSIKRVWGSLNAAEAGSNGASYINTSDLGSAGVVLNLPCYYDTGADTTAVTIDGWTTSANNYIKIYTPNNTTTEANNSQRHSGKWDEGKWRMEKINSSTIFVYEEYATIEGLQLKIDINGTSAAYGIYNYINNSNSRFKISSNIIKAGSLQGSTNTVSGISSPYGYASNMMVYNNVVYDFTGGENALNVGIAILSSPTTVYNNTVYNCKFGFRINGGTAIAKNNLSYNNTDNYYGTFDASSANNLSGPDQTDAPGSNPQNAKTVSFEDSANYDFHLSWNDTVARGMGTDLRFDPNLPISNDIDGHTRTYADKNADTRGSSIGADEPANKIFRSVGPSATSALTTGGSNALTISGNIASFATALADNIGVGDAIQYDSDNNTTIDSIAFISKRTDSTHYVLQSPHGTYPNQTSTSDLDWSLFRSYSSLSNAEAATENTGINSTVRYFDDWSGGKDIASTNEQWNLAAYANGTTADTTAVTISGWTTALPNYVKVYTPTQTTEVGVSQRHQGKWDDSKYKMEITTSSYGFGLNIYGYVTIDGLQLKVSTNNTALGVQAMVIHGLSNQKARSIIENNIVKQGSLYSDTDVVSGIEYGAYSYYAETYILNNIVYDFKYGIYQNGPNRNWYVYNNTVYGCGGSGIGKGTGGVMKAKNNLSYNNVADYGNPTYFDSSSTHNLSKDATAPAFGTYYRNATVTFLNTASGSEDFHLSPNDTAARNKGISLVADSYLPFDNDIDGESRPSDGQWDIGADELHPRAIMNGNLKFNGNVRMGN